MTKADIVLNISDDLGLDRADVQATVEKFMKEIKSSLEKGENVYLRGLVVSLSKHVQKKLVVTFQKILQLKFLLITFPHSNQLRFLHMELNLK